MAQEFGPGRARVVRRADAGGDRGDRAEPAGSGGAVKESVAVPAPRARPARETR